MHVKIVCKWPTLLEKGELLNNNAGKYSLLEPTPTHSCWNACYWSSFAVGILLSRFWGHPQTITWDHTFWKKVIHGRNEVTEDVGFGQCLSLRDLNEEKVQDLAEKLSTIQCVLWLIMKIADVWLILCASDFFSACDSFGVRSNCCLCSWICRRKRGTLVCSEAGMFMSEKRVGVSQRAWLAEIHGWDCYHAGRWLLLVTVLQHTLVWGTRVCWWVRRWSWSIQSSKPNAGS